VSSHKPQINTISVCLGVRTLVAENIGIFWDVRLVVSQIFADVSEDRTASVFIVEDYSAMKMEAPRS
jgi:hypothetical protein